MRVVIQFHNWVSGSSLYVEGGAVLDAVSGFIHKPTLKSSSIKGYIAVSGQFIRDVDILISRIALVLGYHDKNFTISIHLDAVKAPLTTSHKLEGFFIAKPTLDKDKLIGFVNRLAILINRLLTMPLKDVGKVLLDLKAEIDLFDTLQKEEAARRE